MRSVTASASAWCYATVEERRWWSGLWADRTIHSAYAHRAVDGGHATAAQLEAIAAARPTAMMCSEALWWRCHRRLIADRLVASGWEVLHIGTGARAEPHRLSDFGVVQADGRVVYPAVA